MQSLPIYLYQNIIDVILDLDPTIHGVNQVMYQRDLKIQKGLKNQIRIQFKNSDQKRITISTSTSFVFSMYDTDSQKLMITKKLSVLDDGSTLALRGLAELTLDEGDTINLNRSSYKYSVKKQDVDGTYLPTYTNTYYDIAGTLHLYNDVNPVLQPSQTTVFQTPYFNAHTNLFEHKSGSMYAYPEYKKNTALHTIAYYMTNFKGTVLLQATLDNQPNTLDNFVTLDTRTYTGGSGFSGIDYINFNGIYSYVRVMYIPELGPTDSQNNNPTWYGSFDKILYRC